MAFAGEKIDFSGAQYQLPLPNGQGRSIRLSVGPNPSIPIYLATLGTKSLQFTGAAADGWIGTSFTPEYGNNLLDDVRLGARQAGRQLRDFDVHVGAAAAGRHQVAHYGRGAARTAEGRRGAARHRRAEASAPRA